ncbi:MAG TPA: ABC transporter permease [Candidatus Tectomicrobia bacterium]|nr:ABC transporter permease [Candidatus Tectomicrobia bacterium]
MLPGKGTPITGYLIRRLWQGLIVLVGASIIVFCITTFFADPAKLMLPIAASQTEYEQLKEKLGFYDPAYLRLLRFTSGIVSLDFGKSLWQGVPAMQLVLDRLTATALLSLSAIGLATLIGVPFGTFAALKPGSALDRVCTILSLTGVSVADFWLGLMLILLFSVNLRWLPTSGYGAVEIILPALTLAARPIGRIALITRSAMLDELNRPYIITARAKGLFEGRVVFYHALKNAALTVVTLCGYEIGRIFAGYAVIVETLFGWPGIGQLAVQSISNDDLPVVQAVVFVAASIVVVLNIIIDLCYAVLDPRIRYT